MHVDVMVEARPKLFEAMFVDRGLKAMKMKWIISLACFMASSGPAHAYLDPGSVSLAVQAIVAALAGAALTWRHWYWRLRSILGLYRKRKLETDESECGAHAPRDENPPPPRE